MNSSPRDPLSAHRGARLSNWIESAFDLAAKSAGFRRQRVVVDGIETSFLLGQGRGQQDLILLHGLGDRSSTWALLLRRLAKGPWGRILIPDIPGFGYSSLPVERLDGLGLGSGVEFLQRFIASQCEGPAVVVGNSLGGWIAWRTLQLHPENVRGSLLLAPAGFMDVDELTQTGALFRDPDGRFFAEACLADANPLIKAVAARMMTPVLHSEVVQRFARIDSREHLLEPGSLAPLKDRIRVLWGTDDDILPQTCLARMKQELGARVVVEKIGHAAQRTRPGMVLRELKVLRLQMGAEPAF